MRLHKPLCVMAALTVNQIPNSTGCDFNTCRKHAKTQNSNFHQIKAGSEIHVGGLQQSSGFAREMPLPSLKPAQSSIGLNGLWKVAALKGHEMYCEDVKTTIVHLLLKVDGITLLTSINYRIPELWWLPVCKCSRPDACLAFVPMRPFSCVLRLLTSVVFWHEACFWTVNWIDFARKIEKGSNAACPSSSQLKHEKNRTKHKLRLAPAVTMQPYPWLPRPPEHHCAKKIAQGKIIDFNSF